MIHHDKETNVVRTSQIALSAGTIEYEDSGGDGPVILMLHGLMMDASLWQEVIENLATEYRCIAPRCHWEATARG